MDVPYIVMEKELARCAVREKRHWAMHLVLVVLLGGSIIMKRSGTISAAIGRKE